jgi:hypothetical protein
MNKSNISHTPPESAPLNTSNSFASSTSGTPSLLAARSADKLELYCREFEGPHVIVIFRTLFTFFRNLISYLDGEADSRSPGKLKNQSIVIDMLIDMITGFSQFLSPETMNSSNLQELFKENPDSLENFLNFLAPLKQYRDLSSFAKQALNDYHMKRKENEKKESSVHLAPASNKKYRK